MYSMNKQDRDDRSEDIIWVVTFVPVIRVFYFAEEESIPWILTGHPWLLGCSSVADTKSIQSENCFNVTHHYHFSFPPHWNITMIFEDITSNPQVLGEESPRM